MFSTILNEVKTLKFFKDDFASLSIVAEYYDVSIKTIENSIRRHYEISTIVLTGQELKNFKKENGYKSHCGSLTLFKPKDVLMLSFLLHDSSTANNVVELCRNKYKSVYMENAPRHIRLKKFENIFEQCLIFTYGDLITFEKQVYYKGYYIDFLINNKLIIEVDENGHGSYNKTKEEEREKTLKELDCDIVRFNPQKDRLIDSVIPSINTLL